MYNNLYELCSYLFNWNNFRINLDIDLDIFDDIDNIEEFLL